MDQQDLCQICPCFASGDSVVIKFVLKGLKPLAWITAKAYVEYTSSSFEIRDRKHSADSVCVLGRPREAKCLLGLCTLHSYAMSHIGGAPVRSRWRRSTCSKPIWDSQFAPYYESSCFSGDFEECLGPFLRLREARIWRRWHCWEISAPGENQCSSLPPFSENKRSIHEFLVCEGQPKFAWDGLVSVALLNQTIASLLPTLSQILAQKICRKIERLEICLSGQGSGSAELEMRRTNEKWSLEAATSTARATEEQERQ